LSHSTSPKAILRERKTKKICCQQTRCQRNATVSTPGKMAIIPEGGMKIKRAELELGMMADVVVPAPQELGW
jgi:hypothetical protein